MRLTIRERLIAVVCLSPLPIMLLGYLFVTQSQKDIAFGSTELDGTLYYAALAPDLAALSGAGAVPADTAFAAMRARFDGEMSSAPLADAYATLRAGANAPAHSP